MNSTSDIANEPATMATPSQWPHLSVRRPPSSSTAAPKAGSATTSASGHASDPAEDGSTTGTCPSVAVAARAAKPGVITGTPST